MIDTGSIFNIHSPEQFHDKCLEVFRYQYRNNETYRRFTDELGLQSAQVGRLKEIPFLPVSFFKNGRISTLAKQAEVVFRSSGTTGMQRSEHHVADLSLYHQSIAGGFSHFFGDLSRWAVFALLPGYAPGSSLVHMARKLMHLSGSREVFYEAGDPGLETALLHLKNKKEKILLLGVTHALLEWSETVRADLSHIAVMETGGMKGRGKERVREEVHAMLKEKLGVEKVYSEYGMTELLSQAYSEGGGVFRAPPWMKVLVRDPYDPLSYMPEGRSGGINIIDLANVYSCSFLETGDIGRILPGGSFEILGRFDHSDIRGCNLLFE